MIPLEEEELADAADASQLRDRRRRGRGWSQDGDPDRAGVADLRIADHETVNSAGCICWDPGHQEARAPVKVSLEGLAVPEEPASLANVASGHDQELSWTDFLARQDADSAGPGWEGEGASGVDRELGSDRLALVARAFVLDYEVMELVVVEPGRDLGAREVPAASVVALFEVQRR